MSAPDIYRAQGALIEQAIAVVCRRHRLSSPDAEDFAGEVRLHLLNDDCAVLRRFQGRSSLKTYVVTVAAHLYQDWRNARWGKWRPSAEARRLGPLAILLERLVLRDRLTFEEACETLRTNHGVNESRPALEAMAARFPARAGRHLVADDVLRYVPGSGSADEPLARAEAAAEARDISARLGAITAALPAQDRLILAMRFTDGYTVAEIGKTLHLEQKPLYRRMERLLLGLRAALEAQGVSASEAVRLLDVRAFDGTEIDGSLRERHVPARWPGPRPPSKEAR